MLAYVSDLSDKCSVGSLPRRYHELAGFRLRNLTSTHCVPGAADEFPRSRHGTRAGCASISDGKSYSPARCTSRYHTTRSRPDTLPGRLDTANAAERRPVRSAVPSSDTFYRRASRCVHVRVRTASLLLTASRGPSRNCARAGGIHSEPPRPRRTSLPGSDVQHLAQVLRAETRGEKPPASGAPRPNQVLLAHEEGKVRTDFTTPASC